jgi:hypothetical protein
LFELFNVSRSPLLRCLEGTIQQRWDGTIES